MNGQHKTQVIAENEAWFYSRVTVSSCAIIKVYIAPQMEHNVSFLKFYIKVTSH